MINSEKICEDLKKVLEEARIRHEKDVKTLRINISALTDLTDEDIEYLYSYYGEETHCAGWLFVCEATVKEFERWLLKSPLERYLEDKRAGKFQDGF